MFQHIMVPVDLAEKDNLSKAMSVAADLAHHYTAKVTLVSVTGGLHARLSYSEQEYAQQLSVYAREIAEAHAIEVSSQTYNVPDPSVEVDHKLIEAVAELGADLAVIASHQPGWVEHLVNSHGGRLASHAPISVLVVRD